jgi:hypothetical protein
VLGKTPENIGSLVTFAPVRTNCSGLRKNFGLGASGQLSFAAGLQDEGSRLTLYSLAASLEEEARRYVLGVILARPSSTNRPQLNSSRPIRGLDTSDVKRRFERLHGRYERLAGQAQGPCMQTPRQLNPTFKLWPPFASDSALDLQYEIVKSREFRERNRLQLPRGLVSLQALQAALLQGPFAEPKTLTHFLFHQPKTIL